MQVSIKSGGHVQVTSNIQNRQCLANTLLQSPGATCALTSMGRTGDGYACVSACGVGEGLQSNHSAASRAGSGLESVFVVLVAVSFSVG
eukprot:m.279359 g.279359  ORF g.279359 m.279359 type:complete len:89 (+) comp15742_c0_seq2:480-746(+)